MEEVHCRSGSADPSDRSAPLSSHRPPDRSSNEVSGETEPDETAPGEITRLLIAWEDGDERALLELVPLVYDELRRRASVRLRHESSDSTLQATALVHEVYLRLVDQSRVGWRGRAHFFSIATLMMRRIVIDHARRRRYAKRGGGTVRVSLDQAPEGAVIPAPDVLVLDQALHELTAVDPELARLVELRFFGGLTSREIGEVLGISIPTVTRRWRLARAWLYRYLQDASPGDTPLGDTSPGEDRAPDLPVPAAESTTARPKEDVDGT
jgi:RNA polymerase sigma factor (TIGR02999 family)